MSVETYCFYHNAFEVTLTDILSVLKSVWWYWQCRTSRSKEKYWQCHTSRSREKCRNYRKNSQFLQNISFCL